MLKKSLRYTVLQFVATCDKRDKSGWISLNSFFKELERQDVYVGEIHNATNYLVHKGWIRLEPNTYTHLDDRTKKEVVSDVNVQALMLDEGWEEWARFKKESDATVRANWSLGVAIAAALVALVSLLFKGCDATEGHRRCHPESEQHR